MFRFLRRVFILLVLFVIIFLVFRFVKPEATNRFVDKVKWIPTTISSRFHREKKSEIVINWSTTSTSSNFEVNGDDEYYEWSYNPEIDENENENNYEYEYDRKINLFRNKLIHFFFNNIFYKEENNNNNNNNNDKEIESNNKIEICKTYEKDNENESEIEKENGDIKYNEKLSDNENGKKEKYDNENENKRNSDKKIKRYNEDKYKKEEEEEYEY